MKFDFKYFLTVEIKYPMILYIFKESWKALKFKFTSFIQLICQLIFVNFQPSSLMHSQVRVRIAFVITIFLRFSPHFIHCTLQ
jgi:hypothetical protein